MSRIFCQSQRKALACLLLIAALIMGLETAEAQKTVNKGGWEILKIGGRDFVSAKSIKSFYKFSSMSRNGKILSMENQKVRMKLSVGAHQCMMNNVKFVLSHPITPVGSDVFISRTDLTKLIDPVLRPNFIKAAGNVTTVILDPGHGGKDPGAVNSYTTEAKLNLKLAMKVRRELEAKGFRVRMTRTTNQTLSLQQRVDRSNSIRENAIFISLHFNAGQRSARGIETFTLSPPGVAHYGSQLKASDGKAKTGNNNDSANIALATAVHGMVLRRIGDKTIDRGIKRARFNVLTGIKHPAILFEGGFMSHPQEARLVKQDSYLSSVALGIRDAVIRYRTALNRGRTTHRR